MRCEEFLQRSHSFSPRVSDEWLFSLEIYEYVTIWFVCPIYYLIHSIKLNTVCMCMVHIVRRQNKMGCRMLKQTWFKVERCRAMHYGCSMQSMALALNRGTAIVGHTNWPIQGRSSSSCSDSCTVR